MIEKPSNIKEFHFPGSGDTAARVVYAENQEEALKIYQSKDTAQVSDQVDAQDAGEKSGEINNAKE